ncbi:MULTISPECIES: rhomboid family intramembrane serine protease [unclassified Flavobacterium]|uniref:rhomboid family intramembrane serine protease n=1 Tax=unclassified Flavobacterium TaxID=196869 RepID=UPI001F129E0E|nr:MULTISPECIES: rhomboid family intramembrane serine protease [unclassified Flavobacterium]UMY66964.1 rhomboid family intramembrane serine protease [Flavobacterium sp. HJ-32-4]
MDDGRHFQFSPSVYLMPLLVVVPMWFVFGLQSTFHHSFDFLGILPRHWSGLPGIVFSPFLHGNLGHIASNTPPLLILIAALVYFYRRLSLKVLLFGILLSGFITWVIGRDSYHIGASGLVYVLVGFIFFKGLMTQYYRLVALSFAVVLMYGGLIWYMFPGIDEAVSWEAHLGGMISGFAFAVLFRTPNYHDDLLFEWQRPDYDPSNDKFMQRFDEQGNFVNPPPPEPEPVEEELQPGIRYHFIPIDKERGED